MDKKFLRIQDKGCAGVNGALHIDAIRRFEIEEDGGFNIYAYTDSQRHLVNGYGSRMEADYFMKMLADGMDFDIEYDVRTRCRTSIFSLFNVNIGKHMSFRDIADMRKHDFNASYCDETLQELVDEGYLVRVITRSDNDEDNEYFCPTTPPPEAIQNMIGGCFNTAFKGQCNDPVQIQSAMICGLRRYPCYPGGWKHQLYSLIFQLGYARDTKEDDTIGPGRNREQYSVFIEKVPDSYYDEETEIRTYDIDDFIQAIEDRK